MIKILLVIIIVSLPVLTILFTENPYSSLYVSSSKKTTHMLPYLMLAYSATLSLIIIWDKTF